MRISSEGQRPVQLGAFLRKHQFALSFLVSFVLSLVATLLLNDLSLTLMQALELLLFLLVVFAVYYTAVKLLQYRKQRPQ
ncbi:MAG: hypothetical protein QXH08_05045 [Candidatus Hadarchaeales archaeon]